jgi:SOS response regulatory protein OraA/RecX
MRANEFVLEGPIDKAGDWMQGQVIGRKQKNRAAAKKQNVPKIAKLIHQSIAGAISPILAKKDVGADVLADVVAKILKKNLKKDISNTKFKAELQSLVSAIVQNPKNIETDKQVYAAVESIVDKVASGISSDDAVSDKLLLSLQKAIEAKDPKLTPQEAKKFIGDQLRDRGYSKEAIQSAVDELLGDKIDTEEPGKEPNTEPSKVADIIAKTEESLLSNPATSTGNRDEDKANAAKAVRTLFNRQGFTISHPEYDQATDKILGDPRMSWNGGFRATVYAPEGWQESRIVYVLYKGDLGKWKILSSDNWEFISPVTDKQEIDAIETLVNANQSGEYTMDFAKIDKNHYKATGQNK